MAKEQFVSLKFKELRIVLDPQSKKEVQGQLVATSLYGKFPTGFTAEFKNGVFETSDEAVASALREHPYHGVMFVSTSHKGAVEYSGEGAKLINERKAAAADASKFDLTCPECGKQFANKGLLAAHMKTHAAQ